MSLLYVLHPCPEGWRWAVTLGTEEDARRHPLRRCVNAGISPTREEADRDGQLVLYSIQSLCRINQVQVSVRAVEFDLDVCGVK